MNWRIFLIGPFVWTLSAYDGVRAADASIKTDVCALLRDPAQYDGKVVTVRATVESAEWNSERARFFVFEAAAESCKPKGMPAFLPLLALEADAADRLPQKVAMMTELPAEVEEMVLKHGRKGRSTKFQATITGVFLRSAAALTSEADADVRETCARQPVLLIQQLTEPVFAGYGHSLQLAGNAYLPLSFLKQ